MIQSYILLAPIILTIIWLAAVSTLILMIALKNRWDFRKRSPWDEAEEDSLLRELEGLTNIKGRSSILSYIEGIMERIKLNKP